MDILRLGHATLLVTTDDTSILIDPGTFSSAATFELTGLDAIVVTHQHADHLDPERSPRLIDANPDALLLGDPETVAQQRSDRWNINEDGRESRIGDLVLRGVGSRHAEILPSIPRVANVGVLVDDGATTLFHPGDTYEYAPPGVDVLALPLTAPWAKVSETVDFAARVAPTTLFPIHDAVVAEAAYGIFWGHVQGHAGVQDTRRLAPGETLTTS